MSNWLADSIAVLGRRISSVLGPRGMRVVAGFNKWVNNPMQRLWAPYVPYMAVVEHEGRKSGKAYRTPVMAFVDGGVLVVILNYGTEADWVRNVRAAGSASVVHRGKRYRLTDPRVVPVDSTELPPAARAVRTTWASSALCGTLHLR